MRVAALVLALIGGFVGLPAALCSGMCAAALTAAGSVDIDENGQVTDSDPDNEASNAAGSAFMIIGILASILAIIGGIMALKPGHIGTILIVLGLVGNGLTLITFNPLSLIVVFMLLLAAILCGAGKVASPAAPAA